MSRAVSSAAFSGSVSRRPYLDAGGHAGHADFSTEMERVLQVLDYAVLIISAADGVTGQVRILWRLLDHYGVPVFIFVNKMDQPGLTGTPCTGRSGAELGNACVDLQGGVFGSRSGRQ